MYKSNYNYANQTGCNCCNCSWWCSCTAKQLSESIGTIGSAFVTAKLKKNPPAATTTTTSTTPAKPSIWTAKNIAIGSVAGIVVIGAIAAGIYVVKKKANS